MSKGKVLIIENFGADFFQSRTALALSLINQGYEVHALLPNDGFGDKLVELGIKVNSYSLDRSNKGVIQIFKLIYFYRQLFKREQYDIIHSFRFQPNLISCFAKLRISKSKLILHITGLGIAFSSKQFKFLVYKFISQCIYLFKFCICDVVIVQNPDDTKTLFASSIFPRKIHLIEGSGVDIQKFVKSESNIRAELGISKDAVIFTCITRLIWEKGIRELLTAFDMLNKIKPECKLILAGWPDIDNPQHIPLSYFNSWKDSTHVFFLGKRMDISSILSGSDVYIYPSYYREGIPRSILEALSIGLPILTTNTPGCNLTVNDGENGYLFEPGSSEEIFRVVTQLMSEKDLIKSMAKASRTMAEKRFSMDVIVHQINLLYNNILKR